MSAGPSPQTIEEIRAAAEEQVEFERRKYATDPDPESSNPEGTASFSSKRIREALSRNEDGDAGMLIELCRGRFVWDSSEGRWYVNRGHYWELDTLGEAMRAIDAVIECYALEAERQNWQRAQAEKSGNTEKANRRKVTVEAIYKRIRALQSLTRKKAVLELARTGADSLAIRGDEWDRDPWVLGCLNGVIDLKTGELRAGRPDDFIKTISPVEYHGPEMLAPTWEQVIFDIADGDKELAGYFPRLFGYGITGLTNWHIFPVFWGADGRNGKGTMLEAVKSTLGGLASKTRAESLLESRNTPGRGSADADTLALRGKRIIWASEISEGRKLNASRIKELCGGDTLNARAVYGRDPIEFSPSHLLILLTNEKPYAPADDMALWERIHLVPFEVRFVDNPQGSNERKADHDLSEKLMEERPGILAWMVRGCLEWQRDGLNPPECVRMATAEYREDEDTIRHFIDDRCVTGDGLTVKAGEIYDAYRKWAVEMGHSPLNLKNFGTKMKRRFQDEKSGCVFYKGIGLLHEGQV